MKEAADSAPCLGSRLTGPDSTAATGPEIFSVKSPNNFIPRSLCSALTWDHKRVGSGAEGCSWRRGAVAVVVSSWEGGTAGSCLASCGLLLARQAGHLQGQGEPVLQSAGSCNIAS